MAGYIWGTVDGTDWGVLLNILLEGTGDRYAMQPLGPTLLWGHCGCHMDILLPCG